jgi:hypothetical protein
MRTTLDIADDVMFAAKDIARREKNLLGQIIRELARRAFSAPSQPLAPMMQATKRRVMSRKGWRYWAFIPCPSAEGPPTMNRSTGCATLKASDAGTARHQCPDCLARRRPCPPRTCSTLAPRQRGAGWANCPVTQNGVLRVMSQSGCSNPKTLPLRTDMLQRSITSRHHNQHPGWPPLQPCPHAQSAAADRSVSTGLGRQQRRPTGEF